jgi:hypothetical protein
LNKKVPEIACQLKAKNDPSSLWGASLRQATHGFLRTFHGGKRAVMLKGSIIRHIPL